MARAGPADRIVPGMPESTEAGLIAAARGGDVQALEALVLRHQDRVYRFGMKMCWRL